MAKSLDKLSIEITANASDASKALKTLTDNLTILGDALNAMDFKGIVGDLKNLSSAMKGVNAKPLSKDMTKLAQATTKYRNATNQINAESKNANASFSSLSNGVNNVYGVLTKVNSKINEYASRLRSANKETKNFAQTVGLLYARFFLLIRGIKTLTRQVKSSMDYIEVLNYFDSSFGQVAERGVEKWSEMGYESAQAYYDSFSDRAKKVTADMSGFFPEASGALTALDTSSLGMNPQDLMQYQSMFAQMSSSMGTTSEQALLLSEVLTKIGADLASVKNLDFDEVWGNMASGLVGMSRTLDRYGVNIRNSAMQLKLQELGINANVSALTQADKALLRTIILLDETKYAWTDMASTLNTPANQMRMLSNNVHLLGQMIGNILLPVVAKILPYLNAFVIALQRLFTWLANILGIDLSKLQASSKNMDNSSLSDMLDDAEGLSDALDDDTKNAKKLKKQLQGFDALNNLTSKEDTDKMGLGEIGGLLNDAFLDAVNDYLKAWQDAFDKLENSAKDIADKIQAFFEKLWKPIANAWSKIGSTVVDAWKKAFKSVGDLLKKVGEDAMEVWQQRNTEKIFYNIFAIIKDIGEVVDNLASRFKLAWSENENGLHILESIRDIVEIITRHYKRMADATVEWSKKINFAPLLEKVKEYADSLKPVVDNLYGVIEDFYTRVLLPLSKWTLEEGLPDFIEVLIGFNEKVKWVELRNHLRDLFDAIERFGETVGQGLIIFFEDLTDVIANFLNGFGQKIIDWFADFLDSIKPEDIANSIEIIIGSLVAFKGVLLGFTAIKGLSATIDTLKGLKPVVTIIKNLVKAMKFKVVSNFVVALESFKGLGFVSTIQVITKTFGQWIASLPTLVTGLLGVIAVAKEFSIVKDSAYNLASGVGSAGEEIVKIVGIIGVASVAMYGAFGWTGVVIAGIVGVVSAIKGVSDALEESLNKDWANRMKEILSPSDGVSVDEAFGQFSDAVLEIGDGFTEVTSRSGELDIAKENIKGVADSIELIRTNMENGVISVEDGVAQLNEQFDNLAQITKDKFSLIESSMLSVLGENGALHGELEQLGADGNVIVSTITGLNKDVIARMEELKTEMSEVDVNSSEWQAMYDEYIRLAGGIDEATVAVDYFNSQISEMTKFNFADYLDENGAINVAKFSESLNGAVSSIQQTQEVLKSSSETLDEYFGEETAVAIAQGNTKVQAELENYRMMTSKAFDNMSTDVAQKGTELTDAMQKQLVENVNQVVTEAENKWGTLTFAEQVKLQSEGISNKDEYVQNQVSKYKSEVIKPLADEIENSFGELGVEGAGWADEAIDQILSEGFSLENNGYDYTTVMANDISSIVQNAIDEASSNVEVQAEEIGTNIGLGAINGIGDQVEGFSAINTTLGQAGIDAMKDAVQTHSPSAVYYDIGFNCALGLINGFDSISGQFPTMMSTLAQKASSAFSAHTSSFISIGANLMNGLRSGISSASSGILSMCGSIADKVTSTFRNVWRIHSPSRVMDDMGVYFMQGFQNGIESMYVPIEESIGSFGTKLASAPSVSDAVGDIESNVGNLSSNMTVSADNADTNALLRQQNAILQQILEKEFGISEGELFKSVQRSAESFKNRTGDYAFN